MPVVGMGFPVLLRHLYVAKVRRKGLPRALCVVSIDRWTPYLELLLGW